MNLSSNSFSKHVKNRKRDVKQNVKGKCLFNVIIIVLITMPGSTANKEATKR